MYQTVNFYRQDTYIILISDVNAADLDLKVFDYLCEHFLRKCIFFILQRLL